jgi:uncharacterized protein (DUF2236 family)
VARDPLKDEVGRRKTHAERVASRDGYPLVAAGVVYHSDYQEDLWRRLLRTLQALYLIVYGSNQEAERAGEAVQAVHAHVRGTTREQLGRFPAGTPYDASDPELMLWVHATLVASSLAAYRRFVARLTPDEEQAYYREMAVVARVFGLAAAAIPPTLADFREYLRAQLAGSEISVTTPARQVAGVILEAPLPAPLRLLAPAHRLATAALLPARLRDEYGLGLSRAHAVPLALVGPSLRVLGAPLFHLAGRVSSSRSLVDAT